MAVQQYIKEGIYNNICLIKGGDNPADPLTKSDRACPGALNSLMSTQTLPRIEGFEWLKQRNAGMTEIQT